MKLKQIAVYAFLLLITGIASAQTGAKQFQIIPEKVFPGNAIEIHYNPEGTELEGLAPVKGTITLYRDYKWETQDLTMRMTDSGWMANYTVPERTALMVCDFMAGNKVDKAKRFPYAWLLLSPQGKQVEGAFTGWALLRAKGMRNSVPDVTSDSAIIGDDVVLFWLNNELRDHPEARRRIFFDAVTFLKRTGAERADSIIRREAAYIGSLNDVTETELLKVRDLYKDLLRDTKKADSIEKVIITGFPDGQLAWDREIFAMFRETNPNVRDSMWALFEKRFSLEDSRYNQSDVATMYYAKVFKAVVFNEIITKNTYTKLNRLMSYSPVSCLYDFYRHIVEYSLERIGEQNRTPEQVKPISVSLIAEIDRVARDKRFAVNAKLSPSQWESSVRKLFSSSYKTHAFILLKTGEPAKAMELAEGLRQDYQYKNADFNGLYTSLLLSNSRGSEAPAYIELCVKENAATPEMITVLKDNYIKKKGTDKDFETYFASLKSQDKVAEQRAHLKASLINKPLPSFNLESNKGGMVDLAKLKGKIVVLDFWATWCGPCKAAMPGMQLAVNKFKDDAKVAFYFVATQEVQPDYRKQIADFMTEKKYNFNVLYDGKDPKSGKLDLLYSKYAHAIGFSGIPQKMIIDGNGNLRWKSTGYMGSPSELADEISYIIELLKAEQK